MSVSKASRLRIAAVIVIVVVDCVYKSQLTTAVGQRDPINCASDHLLPLMSY